VCAPLLCLLRTSIYLVCFGSRVRLASALLPDPSELPSFSSWHLWLHPQEGVRHWPLFRLRATDTVLLGQIPFGRLLPPGHEIASSLRNRLVLSRLLPASCLGDAAPVTPCAMCALSLPVWHPTERILDPFAASVVYTFPPGWVYDCRGRAQGWRLRCAAHLPRNPPLSASPWF
jgi:hypothetical protein